jgi:hypothetical protein
MRSEAGGAMNVEATNPDTTPVLLRCFCEGQSMRPIFLAVSKFRHPKMREGAGDIEFV